MNPKKLDISKLIEKFEVHKRSEGYSERTVEWYQQALGLFQDWLEEENMSICLDDIGKEEARLFILHLKSRPGLKGAASNHTVNNRGQGTTGVLQLAGLRGLHRGAPPGEGEAAQGTGEGV